MSSGDWFGGCLGIVAAGLLGLVIAGPVGALLGALISAVIVGAVVSGQERKRKSSVPAALPPQPSTGRTVNPAEDALRQLEHLRENGLVTPEEYASKRAEILERF